MTHTETKRILLDYCFEYVQQKQSILLESLSDSKQSLNSANHSTAGDKHDTTRAMMHLEIEKKSKQLVEIEKLKRVISQINPDESNTTQLTLGSILETNNGLFYIAINAGTVKVSDSEFKIISLASPLAQALKNSKLNSPTKFMNHDYVITKIY